MTGPKTSDASPHAAVLSILDRVSTRKLEVDPKGYKDLLDEETSSEIASKEAVNRFTAHINRQLLKQLRDEHNLRKKFMPYVYWLVVGVLIMTFGILIASGCVRACGHKFLSDKVLITLMTGTVIDIIGILYIAIRWLFHQPQK